MSPRRYPSDLRDREWALLAALLPVSAGYGRPRLVDLRGVLNGILYVLWTGCQWRALPSEYPHWNTVYGYFRRWRQDGTWEWLHGQLRRQVRVAVGRSHEHSLFRAYSVGTHDQSLSALVVQAIFSIPPSSDGPKGLTPEIAALAALDIEHH